LVSEFLTIFAATQNKIPKMIIASAVMFIFLLLFGVNCVVQVKVGHALTEILIMGPHVGLFQKTFVDHTL
jgi:hypothetical protein